MENKKKGLYLLVVIFCLITAYFAYNPLTVENGKLVMNLSQYISVNASVTNEDKKSVSPITVEYKNFNHSVIEKLYINNKEIIFHELIEGRDTNNNRISHYKFQDGSSVITGGNCFEYYTEFSNKLSHLIDVDHLDLLNIQGENQEQLEFASKNVVIVKVLEQLSNIGIHNSKLSNIYSFNDEQLNKMKQESPATQAGYHDEEKVWTKEDECYIVVFNQVLNELVIDSNEYDLSIGKPMNNQIAVLYNKDGIQMLRATAMYSQKQEEPTEKIMTLKEALSVYKKKYRKESKAKEKYIKGIDLVYVVKETMGNKNLRLIPAWRFTVYEEVGQGNIACVYFDAISQREL